MSLINYLKDIQSPLIILLHDRGDTVIPVGEQRRLWAMLPSRAGVHYTELQWSNTINARIQSVSAAIAYLLLVLHQMGLVAV